MNELHIIKLLEGLFKYLIILGNQSNEIFDSKMTLYISNNQLIIDYGLAGESEGFAINEIKVFDNTDSQTEETFSDFDELALRLNALNNSFFNTEYIN